MQQIKRWIDLYHQSDRLGSQCSQQEGYEADHAHPQEESEDGEIEGEVGRSGVGGRNGEGEVKGS